MVEPPDTREVKWANGLRGLATGGGDIHSHFTRTYGFGITQGALG